MLKYTIYNAHSPQCVAIFLYNDVLYMNKFSLNMTVVLVRVSSVKRESGGFKYLIT